jgi:Protein of unknown function (DUF3102)
MLSRTELSATELHEAAQRIKALRRAATEHAVEIGRELLRVKERLPHGAFVKWVEKACDFKIRTAQDLMKLAREADSNTKLAALMVPSTLRVYLSKTTPPAVRSAILKRLENGEHVSRNELYSEVLDAKSKTKAKAGDDSARGGIAASLFAGPDLLRAGENKADLEEDRSRMVAELILQRLSRKDYELIMDGMNWGVWNRILVWMRAARIVDSERVELVRPGARAAPSLDATSAKLQ